MRQTILEMVRLAREPVLELLLLADKPNLHQEVNDVPQADRQDFSVDEGCPPVWSRPRSCPCHFSTTATRKPYSHRCLL